MTASETRDRRNNSFSQNQFCYDRKAAWWQTDTGQKSVHRGYWCSPVYISQLFSQCECVCAFHCPPESWELMSILWQHRNKEAGLSRSDVSWRCFVVAQPCTPGTIKLKIIGSESLPFIDPLKSVNSSRHKHSRRWRKKCSPSLTHSCTLKHTIRKGCV